ncbi:MAG: xylulokinase [Candidatus Humimicrobiaceae bacterium]
MDKKTKFILGLCVGTSSAKALITDSKGNVICSSEIQYGIDSPFSLWTEQNPEVWFESSTKVIADVINKSKLDKNDFICMGISGQMHSTVFLDSDNNVIRPAILWNDQRTTNECRYLLENIGLKKILEMTSNRPINSFSLPKILWLKNNENQNYKKLKKFCLSKDYIKLKFSGVLSTDPSDASGTLCYDLKNGIWSRDILKEVSINPGILPDITPSAEISGFLSKDMAEITGLPKDLPIITGVADTAGEMIGNNINKNGDCLIKLGTGGDILVYNENYIENDGSFDLFKYPYKGFYTIQVTLSAAASQNWALNKMGLDYKSFFNDVDEGISFLDLKKQINSNKYQYIEDQIAKIRPGSNGLLFLPYMNGERSPYSDPNAKGTIIGLNLNTSRDEIFRSVLEGVGFSIKDCHKLLLDKGYHIDRMVISGGGAKSELWCQIFSDILNSEIIKMSTDEGPSLGVCILSSVALKLYCSVEEASKKFLKIKKVYIPDENNAQKYKDLFDIYHQSYKNLKNIFKKINDFIIRNNQSG